MKKLCNTKTMMEKKIQGKHIVNKKKENTKQKIIAWKHEETLVVTGMGEGGFLPYLEIFD